MYHDVPMSNPMVANRVMKRFMQENAAVSPGDISGRRRPMPPRNLIAQPGSLQALITWNAPQNINNVLGYNVYGDNENNRIANIADPNTKQISVQLPASTPRMFYVSCYNALQESIKVGVLAEASSTSYVVSGTGGATKGSFPPLPPGYPNEPTGGARWQNQSGL